MSLVVDAEPMTVEQRLERLEAGMGAMLRESERPSVTVNVADIDLRRLAQQAVPIIVGAIATTLIVWGLRTGNVASTWLGFVLALFLGGGLPLA